MFTFISHNVCTIDVAGNICPICRSATADTEAIERKKYKKYDEKDRQIIVYCANKGDDWTALAETLHIEYKTLTIWSNLVVNM